MTLIRRKELILKNKRKRTLNIKLFFAGFAQYSFHREKRYQIMLFLGEIFQKQKDCIHLSDLHYGKTIFVGVIFNIIARV